MQDADYIPDAPVAQRPARGKKTKLEDNGTGGADPPALPPGTENIVIKNHFPVARIKRIMQADDDVGKVAQVTPVVVCELNPSLPQFPFPIIHHPSSIF